MSNQIQTVETKPAAPVYKVTEGQLKIITRVAAAEVAVFGKVRNIHKDLVSLFESTKDVRECETVAKRLLFDTLGTLQAKESKVTPTHKVIVNLNNHVRLAFGAIAKTKADHPALPKCPKTKQPTAFALKRPKGQEEWRVNPVEKKPQSPRTEKTKDEGNPLKFEGNRHEQITQRGALVGDLLYEMADLIRTANSDETRAAHRTSAQSSLAAFRDVFKALTEGRDFKGINPKHVEPIDGEIVKDESAK